MTLIDLKNAIDHLIAEGFGNKKIYILNKKGEETDIIWGRVIKDNVSNYDTDITLKKTKYLLLRGKDW